MYRSIEDDMKGKIVLVTGGTSGIGKGCVKMFCEIGCRVVTLGRRTELGEAMAQELNAAGPGTCEFITCDVTETERLCSVIDRTAEKYGRLDVLVNCAGFFPGQRRADEWSVDELREILDTNLLAYMVASKQALPYLRKSHGNIVNIGSVHGTTSVQGSFGYDATKGGIDAITRTLAIDESRNGVRVNNVKPGLIATEMFETTISRQEDKKGFVEWSNGTQWIGRPGKAEEVAYAVVFLASSQASFITGAELMVSGGYELGEGLKIDNPYLASWSAGDRK